MEKYNQPLLIVLFVLLSSFTIYKTRENNKPTLWLIGDSTVRNGTYDRGDGGLWGWGHFIHELFDTTKISIQNKAFGGTSSLSFVTGGFWEKVRPNIKKGDYVLIQFGHNDGNPTTLKGNGDDSTMVTNPKTQKSVMAHSFGYNIRKYIDETKAMGGIPIVLSLVPRNIWKDGKVDRVGAEYVAIDKEVATQKGVDFIDLNKIIADHYDELGEAKVMADYFTVKDHTHTIEAGAKFNAACVVEGLRGLKKQPFKKYLLN
ncbi:rhamnogalacturonan acetylesterase [Mucilaginibacter sp. HMF5004]|uniref:rhamnogalacturonan acetylesterase n=1 Tax=Mucilaginibacter rivuli TaxID=2857527 RepID=UPI001C5CD256|nr:rhamnogalacturonan acetylesterase [Mucilaginibacter rivuli]MBW4889798.1 rhamnogalacturonan acetylesterase [Mucilaginibacter rivuli]